MVGGWAGVIGMGSGWRKMMMMADRVGGWRMNLYVGVTVAEGFGIDSKTLNVALLAWSVSR